MRKFFAQEAYDNAGTNVNDPLSVAHADEGEEITLEEASIILGDSRVLAGEIGRDLSESERVTQISDALEDLALVARDIRQATPQETMLIELVGQAASAGHGDVSPDELIPSMESYVGLSVATEGIVDTARRIWEAIQNFIVRVWNKIRDFFRATVVTGKYKKTLTELKEMVKNAGQAHESKTTFNVSGAAHGLMPDMHSGQVWSHLNAELERMVSIDKVVFKDYASSVLKMGGEIAKAINDFDPKVPERAANELKDKLGALHLDVAPDVTAHGFIGSGTLRFQKHERVVGEPVEVALERLRLTGLKYQKGDAPKGNHNLEGMPAGSVPEMTEALAAAEKMLETLEVFYGQYVTQFYKAADECRTASNKASKAMGELDKAEFGNKSIGYYRSMLNFNTAFANWTHEPFIPMYQHTLRVVSSLFILVRGSLSCYKGKAPEAK
jgi:hypothetical protein